MAAAMGRDLNSRSGAANARAKRRRPVRPVATTGTQRERHPARAKNGTRVQPCGYSLAPFHAAPGRSLLGWVLAAAADARGAGLREPLELRRLLPSLHRRHGRADARELGAGVAARGDASAGAGWRRPPWRRAAAQRLPRSPPPRVPLGSPVGRQDVPNCDDPAAKKKCSE